MNKFLSKLIAVLVLFGCFSVRNPAASAESQSALPLPYTIQKFGLTMNVPPDFTIVLEPVVNGQNGLIWTTEQRTAPPNPPAKIDLLYSVNDEPYFNMDVYVKSTVLPEIVGNGQNREMIQKDIFISGMPAKLIEVTNVYPGPRGEYRLYLREVVLKKDRQIFRWKLTAGEFDIVRLDPVFRNFLAAVRFDR